MKIGLALPSVLFLPKNQDRIFAPRQLFLDLIEGISKDTNIFAYLPKGMNTTVPKIEITTGFEDENTYTSIKDLNQNTELSQQTKFIREAIEYELSFISQILLRAKSDGIDLLHVYMSYYSLYLLENSPIPVVVTLHDPIFPENTVEYLRLKNTKNIHFLSISKRQGELYKKLHIDIDRMIYHGIDTTQYAFHQEAEDYLSFVGRYLPEKGVDIAFNIALKLKKKLRLITSANYVKNDYYKNVLQAYLPNQFIEEHTTIYSDQDKYSFLGKSKVLLFPSSWEEPFGMVQIEAMVTGTPVIAFAQGSTPEIIKDGVTGFLVNISDSDKRGDWIIKKTGIEGMIEAVERIYSLDQLAYTNMRKSCREHIKKYFNIDHMISQHVGFYTKFAIDNNE